MHAGTMTRVFEKKKKEQMILSRTAGLPGDCYILMALCRGIMKS